jgi:hypothetical protein
MHACFALDQLERDSQRGRISIKALNWQVIAVVGGPDKLMTRACSDENHTDCVADCGDVKVCLRAKSGTRP